MVVTMPEANICRLCVNSCNDYKRLYDDMEVYEITVKYFDPMFLNLKNFTAVCFDCWCHIVDFHNFQQTVQLAQAKLAEVDASGGGAVVIKSEIPDQPEEECSSVSPPMDAFNQSICIKDEQTEREIIDDDELLLPEFWFATNETESVLCANEISSKHPSRQSINKKPPTATNKKSIGNTSLVQGTGNNQKRTPPKHTVNPTKSSVTKDVSKGRESLGKENGNKKGKLSEHSLKKNANTKLASFTQQVSKGTAKGTVPGPPGNQKRKSLKHTPKKFVSPRLSSTAPDVSNGDISLDNRTLGGSGDSQKNKYATAKQLDGLIAQFRPNLECEICTMPCPSFTLLQNHCRIEHPTEEFYILCCQRKFSLRSRLEEHLRVHSDDPFKCAPCGKCFSWRVTLQRHIRKCPQYQKVKLQTKSIFKCQECGEVADSASILRKHILKAHVIRKFKCTLCEKSYTANSSLSEHMATHTGTSLHKCQHCPKSFVYRSGWRVHQQKEHAHLLSSDRKPKPKRTNKFGKY